MKIGIIGTRGIPNNYGGFERFVELLVAHPGWDGTPFTFVVYGEPPSGKYNDWTQLREVGVQKSASPITYYWKSTFLACRECDAILCCGVGISVFSLWPLLRRKPLVLNPDGCEWKRTKWPLPGRLLLRAMYGPALLAADRIVLDAQALATDFGPRAAEKSRYIPYQAPPPGHREIQPDTCAALGLYKPYVLAIARLEPENNLETILAAFSHLSSETAELLVVGPKTTPFYRTRLSRFEGGRIRFLGPIFDQELLGQLRSNCLAYIHGHSVGGTNPSLLEALATVRGLIICHDNKYNREVAGDQAAYFTDAASLESLLKPSVAEAESSGPSFPRLPSRDERFHPDTIYSSYLSLFDEVRARPHSQHP